MVKEILKEVASEYEEKDRFFNNILFTEVWSPRVDIYETEKEIILLIELPGVKIKDIKLSLNRQNVLHIWGKRDFPFKTFNKNYHGMEIHFGTFSRYIRFLTEVEDDKAEIKNINGIFKITFKKKELNK
jgi:HSP20 family protein